MVVIPGTLYSEHKRGNLVVGSLLPPLGDFLFRPQVEGERELHRLAGVHLPVPHDQREFELIPVEVELRGRSQREIAGELLGVLRFEHIDLCWVEADACLPEHGSDALHITVRILGPKEDHPDVSRPDYLGSVRVHDTWRFSLIVEWGSGIALQVGTAYNQNSQQPNQQRILPHPVILLTSRHQLVVAIVVIRPEESKGQEQMRGAGTGGAETSRLHERTHRTFGIGEPFRVVRSPGKPLLPIQFLSTLGVDLPRL